MRGLDVVEATVLFRRQLGCTLASLAAVGFVKALDPPADAGAGALRELALGLFVVAVGALGAVTAVRLARVLALADPWRYGFAFFPCLNLVVLAVFGAYLWPAWSAAGASPLFLLQSRRGMEARARPAVLPAPSATGAIVTLVAVVVCVSALHAMVAAVRAVRVPAARTTGRPAASATPAPDTAAYRPFASQGQAALDEASARVAGPDAAGTAFGNTPEAVKAAERVREDLEAEVRRSFAAYPDFRAVAAGSSFHVYVHARPERAAVLVHIPRFDSMPGKSREAMVHFAWRAARDGLYGLRLVGARGVAVGVRGAGASGGVTWGDRTDNVRRQTAMGSPPDTAVLAAYFADARLPLPLPTPRPGSDTERFLKQRGPLETASQVEGLLADCEAAALPPRDATAALSLLGELALGYDARVTPEQERRLALVLRSACQAPPDGSRCTMELRNLWARLDRPFVEDLFRARVEEKGYDQDLWWLLVGTRDRADRARWAQTIEHLVRAELRRGRGAYDAMHVWLEADPAAAERVVLEELAPRSLAPGARLWLAHALLSVGLVRGRTDEAGPRLSLVVALGGPAAASARTAREILGLDSQDRIEALAREWRETRSGKALSAFYYAYIDKLPMGTPFAVWLERLGEPGGRPGARDLSITPRDSGSSLYVEIDAQGRLSGISFD